MNRHQLKNAIAKKIKDHLPCRVRCLHSKSLPNHALCIDVKWKKELLLFYFEYPIGTGILYEHAELTSALRTHLEAGKKVNALRELALLCHQNKWIRLHDLIPIQVRQLDNEKATIWLTNNLLFCLQPYIVSIPKSMPRTLDLWKQSLSIPSSLLDLVPLDFSLHVELIRDALKNDNMEIQDVETEVINFINEQPKSTYAISIPCLGLGCDYIHQLFFQVECPALGPILICPICNSIICSMCSVLLPGLNIALSDHQHEDNFKQFFHISPNWPVTLKDVSINYLQEYLPYAWKREHYFIGCSRCGSCLRKQGHVTFIKCLIPECNTITCFCCEGQIASNKSEYKQLPLLKKAVCRFENLEEHEWIRPSSHTLSPSFLSTFNFKDLKANRKTGCPMLLTELPHMCLTEQQSEHAWFQLRVSNFVSFCHEFIDRKTMNSILPLVNRVKEETDCTNVMNSFVSYNPWIQSNCSSSIFAPSSKLESINVLEI